MRERDWGQTNREIASYAWLYLWYLPVMLGYTWLNWEMEKKNRPKLYLDRGIQREKKRKGEKEIFLTCLDD